MDKDINITLKVWRQKGPNVKGQFETYHLKTSTKALLSWKCWIS